jgi:CubicO group peptidase (beta-lactamase class C family)
MGERMKRAASFLLVLLPALALGQSCGLGNAKPESAGFAPERLERLHQKMQSLIDAKTLAGMVTVLARHGKVLECKAYGSQDLSSAKPMGVDTIFRIYSMSKPVTAVAMMLLFEEGKWRPGDPLGRYIPELAHLKVFAGTDSAGNMLLADPKHQPTVGEVLTHTAGFTYGYFGETPVDKAYLANNPLKAGSLTEFAQRLGKLPLLYQPGESWVYSVAVDVQGLLIERLSGQPLPDFMRERVFQPLGMKDTGFFVPKEKSSRLATLYQGDKDGKLIPVGPGNDFVAADPTQPPGLPSGGGGLYSTPADYLRLAQMLANGGELNGVRLLAPSSVEILRTSHLAQSLQTGAFGIGLYFMQPGLGYGYDGAVLEDPARLGSPAGKGTYLWDGLAGTWFWIDPTHDVVFVGMIQRMVNTPGAPDVENTSRALVYQALVRP